MALPRPPDIPHHRLSSESIPFDGMVLGRVNFESSTRVFDASARKCLICGRFIVVGIVDTLNGVLWNYVLIYGLLGAGAFFTVRLGALQFLHFGEMVRVITSARQTDKCGISPFQALTVSPLSGALEPDGATGMQLTQDALDAHLGTVGSFFVAVAIVFFAFTSILGNYSYAENARTFLGLDGRVPILMLRASCLGMVVWGALQSVQTVFDYVDAATGSMAIINLISILLLSGAVANLTKDYFAQRRVGEEPRLKSAEFPELDKGINREIWT